MHCWVGEHPCFLSVSSLYPPYIHIVYTLYAHCILIASSLHRHYFLIKCGVSTPATN